MSKTKSKQSDGSSTPLRSKKQDTANFKDLGIDVASFDKSPIPQSQPPRTEQDHKTAN